MCLTSNMASLFSGLIEEMGRASSSYSDIFKVHYRERETQHGYIKSENTLHLIFKLIFYYVWIKKIANI